MNRSLFLVGFGKLAFGVLIGAFGIFFGLRVVGKLLRMQHEERALAEGNNAVGVLHASCMIALGLLVQPAVQASFDAMDLLYRGQTLALSGGGAMLGRFAMYAVLHVGTALVVGAGVVALGVFVFNRLTKEVDELAEIRRGNVAPALALGAVLVMMAMMAAPGLRTMLDGLLPLPELPRDTIQMPN